MIDSTKSEMGRRGRSTSNVANPTTTTTKVKEVEKRGMNWSIIGAIFLAVTFGVFHRNHVRYMHESDRQFSHLSTLERELSFRTEMGFYYSYYKQLVDAPSLVRGFLSFVRDNITEYPDTINAFKRFNLWPELVIGTLYRNYMWLMEKLQIQVLECYKVGRGPDMPDITSCEGSGDPAYFYLECVFALSGLTTAGLFLIGREVAGGSVWGGLIACTAFFANHRECTRVQWTPPLRESFSYPLFVVQQLVLVRSLQGCARVALEKTPKKKQANEEWYSSPSLGELLLLAWVTLLFLLPWQLAQFVLATQALALLAAYMVGRLSHRQLGLLARSYLLSMGLAFAAQQGNALLLTSPACAVLVSVLVLAKMEKKMLSWDILRGSAPVRWLVQLCCVATGSLLMKQSLSQLLDVADDAHVWDILRSKFSNFKSFHTLLYTCAPEFDFMQLESLWELTYTLLLPSAGVALLIAVWRLLALVRGKILRPDGKTSAGGDETPYQNCDDPNYCGPEIVYLVCQLFVFTLMAGLIMRLKLFWTPQLCITAALLARKDWLPLPKVKSIGGGLRGAVCALLVAGMCLRGWHNVENEWSIKGTFSNWPQEQLVTWIRDHTSPQASFAGAMPVMATVRLTTWRPVVNHPHYEDPGIRERTKLVYSIFSRRSLEQVWRTYRHQLKVDYLILERSYCEPGSRQPGCSLPELFDLEEPGLRGQIPVCRILLDRSSSSEPFFKRVFASDELRFVVFKVWDGKP